MMGKNSILNQPIKMLMSFSFFLFFSIQAVYAIPQSSHVVAGDVIIQKSGHHIEITQNSDKAIVEWKNFNIGANDSVYIQQPKNGVMLIRVDSKKGTRIEGKLLATGQIILVNQGGVSTTKTGTSSKLSHLS